MKKIVALVLALVMVLSLATVAFAKPAWNPKTNVTEIVGEIIVGTMEKIEKVVDNFFTTYPTAGDWNNFVGEKAENLFKVAKDMLKIPGKITHTINHNIWEYRKEFTWNKSSEMFKAADDILKGIQTAMGKNMWELAKSTMKATNVLQGMVKFFFQVPGDLWGERA